MKNHCWSSRTALKVVWMVHGSQILLVSLFNVADNKVKPPENDSGNYGVANEKTGESFRVNRLIDGAVRMYQSTKSLN